MGDKGITPVNGDVSCQPALEARLVLALEVPLASTHCIFLRSPGLSSYSLLANLIKVYGPEPYSSNSPLERCSAPRCQCTLTGHRPAW